MHAGFYLSGCCIWKKNALVLGRSPYQWIHEPCLFGWKQTGKHQWYSDRKQVTVWEYDKPRSSKDHPTMKPVALMSYPLSNSTMTNGIVLDPFLGSGSTLIACCETDRICRGIELDPKFVDVIVKRYQAWCLEKGMFIVELIKAAFALITLPFRLIWENCKEIILAAWNAIKVAVSTALTAVKTAITTVWNAIKTLDIIPTRKMIVPTITVTLDEGATMRVRYGWGSTYNLSEGDNKILAIKIWTGNITDLNIRKGPGTNYAKTGKYTGIGVFTIMEVRSGQGSTTGWGRLKSGAGWISLDFVARV